MKIVYILPKSISMETAKNFSGMREDLIRFGKNECNRFFCLYKEDGRGDSWSDDTYFKREEERLKRLGFEFIHYAENYIGEIKWT